MLKHINLGTVWILGKSWHEADIFVTSTEMHHFCVQTFAITQTNYRKTRREKHLFLIGSGSDSCQWWGTSWTIFLQSYQCGTEMFVWISWLVGQSKEEELSATRAVFVCSGFDDNYDFSCQKIWASVVSAQRQMFRIQMFIDNTLFVVFLGQWEIYHYLVSVLNWDIFEQMFPPK